VIPERPIDAIEKGSAKNTPVLIGTNLEEWKLFALTDPGVQNMDEEGLIKRLQTLMQAEHVPGIVETYRDIRKERGEPMGPVDLLIAIHTDWMFRMPAIRLIEARQKNNEPAYNYLFTWKSPALDGIFGACHALEIGFLFGNYNDNFCGSGPEADALSLKMQDAWLAFAHTGDPGCETIGPWPPYGDRRTTMILGKECGLEEAPYETERSAWDKVTIAINKPI
jgi:carboxylesterase type B